MGVVLLALARLLFGLVEEMQHLDMQPSMEQSIFV